MARPYSIESGWYPEPLLIAEEISIADARLRRFRVPLDTARFAIINDVKRRFDTETDPDGVPWTDWAESYQARGERENIGKLRKTPEYTRDTPQLYDAAVDPENYVVISQGASGGAYGGGEIAFIGTNMPDYWIYHQEGSPGNKIPQRAFLGVSDEAEAEIFEIFDAHVEGALTGLVGRTGQPQGPGGRFRTFFH